jgi:ATP-dependent DNA helicase DinG
MAEAVNETIVGGGHLIVEAATGIGKSLAYLVPLAEVCAREEQRAVITTYTKALQRQLVEKDLPFLKEHVNPDIRYSLCLGSENYLCHRRLENSQTMGLFDENADELHALIKWAQSTKDGIREGTGGGHWHKISRESDNCHGKDCPHHMRCFYKKARDLQRRSHILVVNHHLYFANLASAGHILPRFEMAVFDEAHELEDVAASYLGYDVSNLRLWHLFNSIASPRGKGILRKLKWLDPAVRRALKEMVEIARLKSEEFFLELQGKVEQQSLRLRAPNFMENTLSGTLVHLGQELKGLSKAAPSEEDVKDLSALSIRAESIAEELKGILDQVYEGHVYWAEHSGRISSLVATPIDIAERKIFNHLEAAVYTSATLSTGKGFNYIKSRLGLEHAETLKLKSSFNYRKQARLYIAGDIPPPNSHGYEDGVITRVGDILTATGGQTLVLFTSYSLMNRASEALSYRGANILCQGDADSYHLLNEFKNGSCDALFGTYTFWQGIDIPGDALKYVVITRLPFAVPDEPLVQARQELLARMGRDPFMHYQVPRAAITLKQGFGRLIRSGTDTGAVAILDSRIVSRKYGQVFLDSLPDIEIVHELSQMFEPVRK